MFRLKVGINGGWQSPDARRMFFLAERSEEDDHVISFFLLASSSPRIFPRNPEHGLAKQFMY